MYFTNLFLCCGFGKKNNGNGIMYIQSKLININYTLIDLDLNKLEGFSSEKISVKPKEGVEIKCSLQYSPELCMIDTQIVSAKGLTDLFFVKGEFIQISLVSKGKSKIEKSIGNGNQHIQAGNVQFTYQNKCAWEIFMPANEPTHYTSLLLSKKYYLNLLKEEKWAIHDKLYQKITNDQFLEMGGNKFPVSFSLHQLLRQITNCDLPERFRENYFGLKLKELFYTYYIQQQIQEPKTSISEDTLQKIKKAKAYLVTHYTHPPTIKELSRKILLNELKLKTGFKEVYGITIRGYVIQLKMKKAQTLLEDHTVYEISNILGYKSTSHFINMFKRYYGYTPKQTLKE